jgi:hypothetical protein
MLTVPLNENQERPWQGRGNTVGVKDVRGWNCPVDGTHLTPLAWVEPEWREGVIPANAQASGCTLLSSPAEAGDSNNGPRGTTAS